MSDHGANPISFDKKHSLQNILYIQPPYVWQRLIFTYPLPPQCGRVIFVSPLRIFA